MLQFSPFGVKVLLSGDPGNCQNTQAKGQQLNAAVAQQPIGAIFCVSATNETTLETAGRSRLSLYSAERARVARKGVARSG